MIETIYIEEDARDHPRTLEILERFPRARRVECERYGEVFNRRAQNFRLQKRRPALILARKVQGRVLPTPPGYGIGAARNFYFSHMLNCLYDCRYCFLQGMYQSAHYVVFVNYEDFFADIAAENDAGGLDQSCFFSGYDCDSLAFEGVTGFVEAALPHFRAMKGAWLELRTKSVHVAPLLKAEPFSRCVIAWSFTPQEVSDDVEPQVPSVERRLRAMAQVQERGWQIGLRLDPLIRMQNFEEAYRRLFADIFSTIDGERVHSVSLGPMRLPAPFFRRVERLYPDVPLFAGQFSDYKGTVSYPHSEESVMLDFCRRELLRYIKPGTFFTCELPTSEST